MSVIKKIMVSAAVLSAIVFAGCATTDSGLKISQVDADINGASFSQHAVASVSDDTENGQDSKVSKMFSTKGTMIYAKNTATNETLVITYGGKKAGTYRTGTATTDEVVSNVLNYLVKGSSSFSAGDFVSAKANVTYTDANGVKWFSTLCTVTISGQENGNTLSLINGNFKCDVYKTGDSSKKKSISGTIHNVVGIQ